MPEAIYLLGPTASGKSAAALALAQRLGGEIISVDSMQVYRGLDITTAKPSLEERQHIPHHLIDVAEITEPFDAARFLHLAREAERGIQHRGKIPIFCGGTGLYFNALRGGLSAGPAPDVELRQLLESTSLPDLLEELRIHDPITFERIDQKNPRRVIRAVEILRTTQKPIAQSRADWQLPHSTGQWIALSRDRADLHQRINQRVDQMITAGLVAEIENLLHAGLAQNRTAMQAIGCRQIAEHLSGERDLPTTIELIKQKTRQFSKRQLTWFRHQLSLTWIQVDAATSPEKIAHEIILLKIPRDNQ